MKHRNLLLVLTLAIFSSYIVVGVMFASAQQSNQSADLEQRITQLEESQAQNIEALKVTNDTYKTLLLIIGGLFGAMVTIQAVFSTTQFRRESRRNTAEIGGVEKVSNIMDLVDRTLQNRLTAENEAREKERRAQIELEDMRKQFGPAMEYVSLLREAIAESRKSIEATGEKLAKTHLNDFKSKSSELKNFSQEFDHFQKDYKLMDVPLKGKFNSLVSYVRGIAAHYENLPEKEKTNLLEVTTVLQPEPGENQVDYDLRVANSYYYLGLIETNFGNYQKAIDYFKEVERKNQMSLRIMVANAEAYMMKGSFPEAIDLLSNVENKLMVCRSSSDRRLLSRAIIMRASIPIMNEPREWTKARQILEPVLNEDPLYYYATATMGQICYSEQNNSRATELFNKAYSEIIASNDLAGTEVRVKVHLLMVTGLCCKHGPMDDKRAEQYLDTACALVDELPKVDSQTCTVFSNLSKKNETSEVIRHHIDLIRRGAVYVS